MSFDSHTHVCSDTGAGRGGATRHFRWDLPKISVALSTFLNIPSKKVASEWKEEKHEDGAVVSPRPCPGPG